MSMGSSNKHPIPSSFVTSILPQQSRDNHYDEESITTTTTKWIPMDWDSELLTLTERFLFLEMKKRRQQPRISLEDFYIMAKKVYQHYSRHAPSSISRNNRQSQNRSNDEQVNESTLTVEITDLTQEELLLYHFACATTPTLYALRQFSGKELFLSNEDLQIWCLEAMVMDRNSDRARLLAQCLQQKRVESDKSNRILTSIRQHRNNNNDNKSNKKSSTSTLRSGQKPQSPPKKKKMTNLQQIVRPLEALIQPGMTLEQRVRARQNALLLVTNNNTHATPPNSTTTTTTTTTSQSHPTRDAKTHPLPFDEMLVRTADALWSHASRQSSFRRNNQSLRNNKNNQSPSDRTTIISKPFTISLKDLVLKLRNSTSTAAYGVAMTKRQIVDQIQTLATHFPEFLTLLGNPQDPETLAQISVSVHYPSIRARLTVQTPTSTLVEPLRSARSNVNSLLHPFQKAASKSLSPREPLPEQRKVTGKRKYFSPEITNSKSLCVSPIE